ncbi:MAG: hypothetical protein ACREXT_09730, partial [Gammaproteobacteria bacterium]
CWGTGRVSGNLIWSTGIQETKTKKKVGGKGLGGKSTSTTYTYSASFAIGLRDCSAADPIAGVRKLWADGKLIYNSSGAASAATLYSSRKKIGAIAIYPGSSTQTADPTIQSFQGAANTPAFRHLAYIVFADLQLADYANRIPNITAEIVTIGSGTAPYRVNTWSPTTDPLPTVNRGGIIERASVDDVTINGDVHVEQIYDRITLDGVLISNERKAKKFSGGGTTSWTPCIGLPDLSFRRREAFGIGIGSGEWWYGIEKWGDADPYESTSYYAAALIDAQHGIVELGGHVFTIQYGAQIQALNGIARRTIGSSGRLATAVDRFMPFVVGVHTDTLHDNGPR